MNNFENITNWLGAGTAPLGWEGIGIRPILILVGVTGVGKTTTTNALAEAGLTFELLPNRRTLTDSLIIRTMQLQDQDPVITVQDRAQRFDYTRRYRTLHPGGMAHALSQLQVAASTRGLLLFDGLRGENEIIAAAHLLPQAIFLALAAPHFVRVQRLLGRDDAFDQISAKTDTGTGESLLKLGVDNVRDLFSEAEEAQLWGLVTSGEVTRSDLLAKVKIVAKERANYDPATTLAALQRNAPERTIVIDTVKFRPKQIAQIVLNNPNILNLHATQLL